MQHGPPVSSKVNFIWLGFEGFLSRSQFTGHTTAVANHWLSICHALRLRSSELNVPVIELGRMKGHSPAIILSRKQRAQCFLQAGSQAKPIVFTWRFRGCPLRTESCHASRVGWAYLRIAAWNKVSTTGYQEQALLLQQQEDASLCHPDRGHHSATQDRNENLRAYPSHKLAWNPPMGALWPGNSKNTG